MAEQALVGGYTHRGALDLPAGGLPLELPGQLAHREIACAGMASPKQANPPEGFTGTGQWNQLKGVAVGGRIGAVVLPRREHIGGALGALSADQMPGIGVVGSEPPFERGLCGCC